MPTEAKQATVAELKEEFSGAKAAIVADYRGLTVSEIGAVRRVLRGEGIKYRVVKNRLAKIAAQEAGRDELSDLLEGPTAIALSSGDEATLAKVFLDAIRPYRSVAVRGAVLGERRIDADSVTRLATLPGREVLLAQLAGGMSSPLATLASLFAAPLRNLGYAFSQLAEKRGNDGSAPPSETHAEATTEAPGGGEVPAIEAPAESEAPAATEASAEAEAESAVAEDIGPESENA